MIEIPGQLVSFIFQIQKEMIKYFKGPTINDVSLKGEGGVQKCRNLLSKKATKGKEGGHKIGKMGRRLWMTPYARTSLHLLLNMYFAETHFS